MIIMIRNDIFLNIRTKKIFIIDYNNIFLISLIIKKMNIIMQIMIVLSNLLKEEQ